jgi:hypothetical protein
MHKRGPNSEIAPLFSSRLGMAIAPPLAYFAEVVRFADENDTQASDPYRLGVPFAGVAQW